MPIEPMWSFYPKFALDFASKYYRALKQVIWITRLCHRVRNDPNRWNYTDEAMTAVSASETETLELFNQNDAAREAVAHVRKVAQLTGNKQTAAGDIHAET